MTFSAIHRVSNSIRLALFCGLSFASVTAIAQRVEADIPVLFDNHANLAAAVDGVNGPVAAIGDPVTLTFSYSNLFDGSISRAAGFTTYEMLQAAEEGLSLWASVTPLTFVERVDSGPQVSDNGYSQSIHPDIRIGHHDISGNVLAHAFFPGGGGIDSDLHLDSSDRTWSEPTFLTTITHELGHTVGLDHQDLTVAIMNSSIDGDNTLPGLGKGFLFLPDITAAQRRWGKGTGDVITYREWTGMTDDRWITDANWDRGWHPTKFSEVNISSDTTVRVTSQRQSARTIRLGVGQNELSVDAAGTLTVTKDLVIGESQGGNQLVAQGAAGRSLVPTDSSVQGSWFEPDFDDSSWDAGATGIGYHQDSAFDHLIGTDIRQRMLNRNATAYTRVEFQVDDASRFELLSLDMKYDDGFVAYLNGTKVASRNNPIQPRWDSTAPAAREDGGALSFAHFNLSQHAGLLKTGRNVLAVQGLNQRAGSSEFLMLPVLRGGKLENRVTVSGGDLVVGGDVRLADDARGASELFVTSGDVEIDGHVIGGNGFSRISISGGTLSVNGRQRGANLVEISSAARWQVPTDAGVEEQWATVDFDDSAWNTGKSAIGYDREFGFSALFETDVETAMYNHNGSVYSRTEFNVEDPNTFNQLSLAVKYDDGFVAYLNGRQVAEANAPNRVQWNSIATTNANEDDVRIPAEFDLTDFRDFLVLGKNVLAIQGLNRSTDSSDFVVSPQLSTSRIAGTIAVDELIFNGGTIAGVSVISGLFQHQSGDYSPTGVSLDRPIGDLRISGSYQMAQQATLHIDIAGASSREHDRLAVQGTATIAGLLLLDVASERYSDPTEPGEFDRIEFLTAESIDGGGFDLVVLNDAPLELGHQHDGLFRWLRYEEQSVSLINYRATYGDSNGDGQFNSTDLVAVFQVGEYEDALAGNSDWLAGDWNGDQDFSSTDFVVAFQTGRYEQASLFATQANQVPEPSGLIILVGLIGLGFTYNRV